MRAIQQGEVAALGTAWRRESVCTVGEKCADNVNRAFGTRNHRRVLEGYVRNG